jgi:GGDEF domain-containing protein
MIRTCKCIRNSFPEYPLFRLGGDEFLVLCSGITKEELDVRIEQLNASMRDYNVVLAVGSSWNDDGIVDMDKLLAIADEKMYASKRQYYKEHPVAGKI